ncbi:SCO family protein [Alloalcanivorax sp. C16-2]|uniref:SCO family protein n=1 Tax=Alloalcanivorax TaxID=3020832 RepID=UPI001931E58F|nr:SCO family protein [Alloalcanivorax marinus]MBL7250240.1 SCO family protein [Alloalcanivorax marinus]
MTFPRALAGRLGPLVLLLALAGCAEPREELPVNTRLGGDFTLTDHNGGAFRLADQRGRVVLMFFGYTHCPDICPATLARVSQVYRNLRDAGDADRVQPLFITFDPARDTPEHLREYVPWFKANVIGLTGGEAEIRAVAEQYGVVFLKSGEGEPEYDFTHSDYVYLLDQQGRVRKLYPSDFNIDEVTDDVQSLL